MKIKTLFSKEYVKTTGNCKKVSSIREGKLSENVPNTQFNDRNCRDRCDKDSSCTGYMMHQVVPHKNNPFNWCVTYTSVGLTGNGRKYYDCWMKGARLFMVIIIGVVRFDIFKENVS